MAETPVPVTTRPIDFHYSVDEVLVKRRAMRDALAKSYLDTVCRGYEFDLFVNELAAMLPASIHRQVLMDSVSHLAGEKLTKEILDTTCWRVAGNIPRLQRQRAAGPWSRQASPEWVPAQIVNARFKKGHRGESGYLFNFLILAGASCTIVIQKYWSSRFCRYVSRDLGFQYAPSARSDKPIKRLYQHPTELVTMRLGLMIDPAMCFREPGFAHIRVTSSLLAWNHEQMDYRDRLSPQYACPFGLPLSLPCHACVHGCVSCRAGCHDADYTQGTCGTCGRSNAMFDVTHRGNKCIQCHAAIR